MIEVKEPGNNTSAHNDYRGPGWRHERYDVVDAQVHLDMSPEAALACMDAVGIGAILIDEFWHKRDEFGNPLPGFRLPDGIFRPVSPFSHWAAIVNPNRFMSLLRVHRNDPDTTSLFAIASSTPYVRAVRISVASDGDREDFARGEYMSIFGLAAKYSMPSFVHLHPKRGPAIAPYLEQYLRAFPQLPMIIDHCGSPLEPDHYDAALRLAEYPNCHMKWSHAESYLYLWLERKSPTPIYPFPELVVQLRRALDAFGHERILWASDYNMNDVGMSWADILSYVRDADGMTKEEKSWILGHTARTLLSLPA